MPLAPDHDLSKTLRGNYSTSAARPKTPSGGGTMRIRNDHTLELDIATRTVGLNEDIHIIQPGEGYHLFEYFQRHAAVFLDFPDLQLSERRKPTREEARVQIVRSLAIRDWHWEEKPLPAPTRDVADYVDDTVNRRLGRYVGAIETLYYDLKPGSIVVVPGPGFDDPVLLGEITGPAHYVKWKPLYDGDRMLVRSVEWLADRPKASFKPEVCAKFGTPNPIMILERGLREQIVRATYDQFVFVNEVSSRLRTSEQEFSTLDDYNIQTFVNYAAGVLAAIEDGYRGAELELGDAIQFLEKRHDLIPELTQNIQSPGYQRLHSSSLTPLVIGALLTLATSGEASVVAGKPAMPTVVNKSAKSGDRCAIEVSEHAARAMRFMKLDEWRRVCAAVRSAKARTGLSTSMTVHRTRN